MECDTIAFVLFSVFKGIQTLKPITHSVQSWISYVSARRMPVQCFAGNAFGMSRFHFMKVPFRFPLDPGIGGRLCNPVLVMIRKGREMPLPSPNDLTSANSQAFLQASGSSPFMLTCTLGT